MRKWLAYGAGTATGWNLAPRVFGYVHGGKL
jgi:hypothetical protein